MDYTMVEMWSLEYLSFFNNTEGKVMQQGWVNNLDSHCISKLRTIFPELLLKSKYVFELCCQRVQKYMVLCVSLETIIEYQVHRNRSLHGIPGSREGNPELTLLCIPY